MDVVYLMILATLIFLGLPAKPACAQTNTKETPTFNGALIGHRYRVIVSTDIGGTDPDDFQSMVHLLLYADVLDIEGLISSPFGQGRKSDILRVIDCYARDYDNLLLHSKDYPTPDALRAITKQGEMDVAPYKGTRQPTEGSEWLVECARRNDPRPLYVLIWGGIEDLAQALHDAPDILPKLRVYWIGGPNKKWSPDAYQYIADHHPDLWIIETNAAYRGWFTGGNQTGQWDNSAFVAKHIAGRGALGTFFNEQLGGTIKMGDTPSVAYLLKGTPQDPSRPSWGGQFVKAWKRPHTIYNRLTNTEDQIEQFGIFELQLPLESNQTDPPSAYMHIENQKLAGNITTSSNVRFRFSPKDAKTYSYTIHSNLSTLNGKTGALTSILPPPEQADHPTQKHSNWWTDNPDPTVAEGHHIGAKTVSKWREEFLQDFAERIKRCQKSQ